MEIGELVAFDDHLLRPSGGAIGTLLDGLANIQARRPTAERFASEDDANEFAFKQRELQHLLSPASQAQDRRGHSRVACDLWVQVRWRDSMRPGVIDDVGPGGVFVSTLTAPELGDRVELIIEPPDDSAEALVRCWGRAAWLGNERRRGFGVAFDTENEHADQLDRLIVALLGRVSPLE